MKKVCYIFTILAMCFSPLYSQEKNYKARAASGSSQDATFLSMAVWGVSLAVGIAALCLLIKNSESSTVH
jgi:hypothetical protein